VKPKSLTATMALGSLVIPARATGATIPLTVAGFSQRSGK